MFHMMSDDVSIKGENPQIIMFHMMSEDVSIKGENPCYVSRDVR